MPPENSTPPQTSPPQESPPPIPSQRHPKRRIAFALIIIAVIGGVAALSWRPWHHPPAPSKVITAPHPSSQAVAVGWLHTSGTEILNSSNQPVRFTGVDDGRMIDGQGNAPDHCGEVWHAPSASDAAAIHAMGLNTVRLGISWANLEPAAPTVLANGQLEHQWNEQYLAALDKVISQYRAQNLWVILDMHQVDFSTAFASNGTCEGHGLPSWLFPHATNADQAAAKCDFFTDQTTLEEPEKLQEGFSSVWTMLAAHYKANPTVVAADMYNEPQWSSTCHGVDLAAFYNKVGGAIRTQNPNILLAEEDGAYENYLKNGFLLKQAPQLPNTVYSWHFYPPDWQTGEPYLQAHLQRAQAWDVPLWIGEFDAFHAGVNTSSNGKAKNLDPNWQNDLAAMMEYCHQNHISWTFWEGDRNSSLIHNGTPKQPLTTLLHQGADALAPQT